MLFLEQATYPILIFLTMKFLCKTNLFGIKGAGEAGAIGAPPAVINAICDALNLITLTCQLNLKKFGK